jgi:glucose dehydrogenase
VEGAVRRREPGDRQHPLLKGVTLPERLGTTGNMGPIVTRGGVVLIGGGIIRRRVRQDDRQGAARVAPQRTSANPMTYRTRAGRQFVVIATGTGTDGTLAAFALKKDRQ